MRLDEAKQILEENGYLIEDYKGKALHDFLVEYGFKHKPHNIFGLFKKVDSGELMAMAGMGECTILYCVWDADELDWKGVDKITVNTYNDKNAIEELRRFIEKYENK